MTFNINETISFTYKGGRKVTGIVKRINEKSIEIKLLTNYIGKNEDWYFGQLKLFNIKEINND